MTHDNTLLLKTSQKCSLKSFGDAHPDKLFYVIRQQSEGGRGMFSLVSSVLCHLDIADRFGLEPVIDFEHFRTVYNEQDRINGTANAWEYFFQPVSPYTLTDVYQSRRVIFSDNGYPEGYSYSITQEPRLYAVYDKYVKFNPDITAAVDDLAQRHFSGRKVLGIQFRGQEMRTASGHWFPPSKKQMAAAVTKLLKEHDFSMIFVVTEEASYLDFLRKRFGDSVIANDHYRTYGVNAYKQYPREQHRYLLGREVIVDALLLARCQGLIGCTSNVATFARFANRGAYLSNLEIDNGPNSNFRPLARCLWFIKNLLPASLGGFRMP
jgi:hypothetical protein